MGCVLQKLVNHHDEKIKNVCKQHNFHIHVMEGGRKTESGKLIGTLLFCFFTAKKQTVRNRHFSGQHILCD